MQERYFQINEEGHSIKCKLYCVSQKDVSRAVLYAHGFGGHKDNKAARRFAEFVLKKHRDAAVITYDAPCHGDDVKKKLRLEDCGAYIRLAAAYVRRQWHTDALYGYATSFGGYQFLKYISEQDNPFRKIALRCPAVNMYEALTETIIRPDEKRVLQKNKPAAVGFDRKIKITLLFLEELRKADITCRDFRPLAENILILHGTKDEVIPFETVKRFADANGIAFVPVKDADHRFIDPHKMDEAIKAVTQFYAWQEDA